VVAKNALTRVMTSRAFFIETLEFPLMSAPEANTLPPCPVRMMHLRYYRRRMTQGFVGFLNHNSERALGWRVVLMVMILRAVLPLDEY